MPAEVVRLPVVSLVESRRAAEPGSKASVFFTLSALISFSAGAALAVAWWARRAAGGLTGDVYGATCELGETAALLCLVAATANGWLSAPGLLR